MALDLSSFLRRTQESLQSAPLTPPTTVDVGGDIAVRPPGTPDFPGGTGPVSPRVGQVLDVQAQARTAQQDLLRQFAGPGREALLRANPQLAAASRALQQQARDPLGGGFGQDLAERIRVQQAARGGAAGGGAAFQEANLLAQAAQQRRLQASQQLQRLGGGILSQLGLGTPITADLGAIGSIDLASRTLSAIQLAGRTQSQIASTLFGGLSGALSGDDFASSFGGLVGGVTGSFFGPFGTAFGAPTGGFIGSLFS